jgi:hypothetical protein
MPNETITAYIRTTAGGTAHHTWVVYTNSAGQSFSMSGWPSGSGSLLRPFGSIDVQVTTWGPNSWDWSGNNNAVASQQMANAPSLSVTWASMTQCAAQIDFANIRYAPLGGNSNSVINTCLLWAGLPPVTIDTAHILGSGPWTPGSEIDLRTFNLNIKHGPDEPDAISVQPLSYYGGVFGFSGAGERLTGLGGGPTIGMFGAGGSGYWIFAEVGVNGGSPSGGWRWVSSWATRIKPVVLDMDGDGLEVTSAVASPGFDFFGTGHSKATGWITGGDAILVRDWNGNGVVDNGSEISFLHDSPGSTTDLQALAAFDTNANGKLDAGDTAFASFRIWTDLDSDGISDSGELQTLSAANIASITLAGAGGGYQVNSNDIYAVTTFTRTNNTTGSAYDVGFEAYDRGSKLLSQTNQWALIELDTAETVAVAKPGAAAVSITDLGAYLINGVSPNGFQLTSGNDSIGTGLSSVARAFYIDGGDGNDVIDLSATDRSSVLKGGAGDDILTGTYGPDFIAPGANTYGDSIYDAAGDDYYVLEQGMISITDSGGMDVAVMPGYDFDDLGFMVFFDHAVAVWANDGSICVWFENMVNNPTSGVDLLVLDDITLTRDQIMTLAGSYFGP